MQCASPGQVPPKSLAIFRGDVPLNQFSYSENTFFSEEATSNAAGKSLVPGGSH